VKVANEEEKSTQFEETLTVTTPGAEAVGVMQETWAEETKVAGVVVPPTLQHSSAVSTKFSPCTEIIEFPEIGPDIG
jgi:RES domain-containing protein